MLIIVACNSRADVNSKFEDWAYNNKQFELKENIISEDEGSNIKRINFNISDKRHKASDFFEIDRLLFLDDSIQIAQIDKVLFDDKLIFIVDRTIDKSIYAFHSDNGQ